MLKAKFGAIRRGRRDKAKKPAKILKARQILERWGQKSTVYKDYKSGGSVITEKLYIDIKQDFKKKEKKNSYVLVWLKSE